jgi:acylphosphatase
MRVARRFLVIGRVQGVGYRMFVWDAAAREGIQGSARNLDDGRVEVLAEGEAEAMTRFERALRQGPGHARVDDVYVEPQVAGRRSAGFVIE